MPRYAKLNSYKGKHASYEIMFIFPMSTYIYPAILKADKSIYNETGFDYNVHIYNVHMYSRECPGRYTYVYDVSYVCTRRIFIGHVNNDFVFIIFEHIESDASLQILFYKYSRLPI